MSCDGMCTIRRDGRDSYYYDKWGATRLDAHLLAGPAAFVAWAEQLGATRSPYVEECICGAVLVDLDRRDVLYWALMCFRGGAMKRYYRTMLGAQWPGFTMREAIEPAREFAAALAVEIPGLAQARAEITLLEAPDDLFTRAWREMLAGYDDKPEKLAEWLAGCGIEGVRSAAEYGSNSWVTVRAADGALYEQLGHTVPWSSLRLGPRLGTLARSGGPRPDILWPGFERDIEETVFVDEATRTVHWWQDHPDWLDPLSFYDALWPGWTLVHEDRGTAGHIERSGRSLAQIRLPLGDQRKQLAEALARLLERAMVPRKTFLREAARLLAGRLDAPTLVETATVAPGASAEAAILHGLPAQLDALIQRVDGF